MGAKDAQTDVRIERLLGADVEPHLTALARLRIEVFREFPYLYEGTMDFEAAYMRDFARSPRSTLVLAHVPTAASLVDAVVGVSTALPLLDHGDVTALAKPFVALGYDPARVYYFGESVLSQAYRGRGIGHAFFDQREASARELGFPLSAFCAVDRPAEHPARPSDYVPHDAFWTRRGYVKRPDMVATFSWRDVGDQEETEKPMVFWLKELS